MNVSLLDGYFIKMGWPFVFIFVPVVPRLPFFFFESVLVIYLTSICTSTLYASILRPCAPSLFPSIINPFICPAVRPSNHPPIHPSTRQSTSYLGGRARGRRVRHFVVIDRTRHHAPHQSYGVVCRGGDGEVHRHVQT